MWKVESGVLDVHLAPNVVIEMLTLLFHIREVLDSNLGPETGYPEAFVGLT
jgi:hypothetical protein